MATTRNNRKARNSANNANNPRTCPVRQNTPFVQVAAFMAQFVQTAPLNYAMAYAGATSPQATAQQKAAFVLLQQHIAAIVEAGGARGTCGLYNILAGRANAPTGVTLPGTWRKMQNSIHLRTFINKYMGHICHITTQQRGKRALTSIVAAG